MGSVDWRELRDMRKFCLWALICVLLIGASQSLVVSWSYGITADGFALSGMAKEGKESSRLGTFAFLIFLSLEIATAAASLRLFTQFAIGSSKTLLLYVVALIGIPAFAVVLAMLSVLVKNPPFLMPLRTWLIWALRRTAHT